MKGHEKVALISQATDWTKWGAAHTLPEIPFYLNIPVHKQIILYPIHQYIYKVDSRVALLGFIYI